MHTYETCHSKFPWPPCAFAVRALLTRRDGAVLCCVLGTWSRLPGFGHVVPRRGWEAGANWACRRLRWSTWMSNVWLETNCRHHLCGICPWHCNFGGWRHWMAETWESHVWVLWVLSKWMRLRTELWSKWLYTSPFTVCSNAGHSRKESLWFDQHQNQIKSTYWFQWMLLPFRFCFSLQVADAVQIFGFRCCLSLRILIWSLQICSRAVLRTCML